MFKNYIVTLAELIIIKNVGDFIRKNKKGEISKIYIQFS